ncbi:MAG: hypothetical protein RMZ42_03655 [Nostoc sp. DedQUE05]|uniref:hypothetical protein n=1 Tax=Nostoc sp. DedQUE05 TaxID=3075391 RepID=UPI002AD2D4B3|nr:hypothetical protein [Nostoc sp. DedQUE05]MDZ8091027.1 hypothetical protein [Nostoc sp. DedQUE05]
MQKQILGLAIALPTILFTALPTLANPVQLVTPKVGNLQPVLVQGKFQTPVIENQLRNPDDGQSPGPTGGNSPIKGPGPRPPRKDVLLQLGTGLQNTIDSSSVNLNIANPVLGR